MGQADDRLNIYRMKIERKSLRLERAITEICRGRKWDPRSLTPQQLASIAGLLVKDQKGRAGDGRRR